MEQATGTQVETRSAAIVRLTQVVKEFWNNAPRSIRFAIPVAIVVVAALAVYLLTGLGASFVDVQVHHSFKSAELTLMVDGSVEQTATLSGSTSRKMFLSKTVGTYTKNLRVSPGRHTIEVRITAPGVEQSRSLTAEFARDAETVLEVSSMRSGVYMSLRQPGPHSYATTSGAIRSNPLTSLLFTLCGSVLSAIVGFYVQEFLHKRKAKAS